MADTGPETGDGGEGGGDGGRAPAGPSGSAACVAPLDPEQLRQVLEQVTKAQPPAQPPPPPVVLQDAARRLRDAARLAALQRGPSARPPRPPRLLPPQQLEAICVKVSSREKRGQATPGPLPAALQPQLAQPRPQLLLRPGPAFRLLVQRTLPALQPVPLKRAMVPEAPDVGGPTPAPRATPHPPAAMPIGPANAFISGGHTKQAKKLRRSLKVRTRSGRISRPPRYKARDYKFIKTEDLADGRPSDSDDYSELSVEEEEGQKACPPLFNPSSCSVRPKAFQCQACDKAYIGRGGLARHFKLHPGHGQLEPGALQSRHTRGSSTEGHQPVDRARLAPTEPSTPADIHAAQGALQLLQQCDQEQLVELILPRLARAVTVYEFLLARAQHSFPAVYREFEQLHGMVKRLCRDYVDGRGQQEPLDISNSELAVSLGVPARLWKDCGHTAGASPGRHETAELGGPVNRPRKDSATRDATELWAAAERGPTGETESAGTRPGGGSPGHRGIVYTGQQVTHCADLEARSSSEQPLSHAVHTLRAMPGRPTPALTGTCPEEGDPGPSPPAARGPEERKAPSLHGPGGHLLENVLSVFEPEPRLSLAGPPGSHTGPLDANQLVGTMTLEVTTGLPALIQASEGLLSSPGPVVSGEDFVILGQLAGPALHGGLPQGAPPEAVVSGKC